jgi:glutathionylspermidine synthase
MPRQKWQKRVEELGFSFHTINDVPYWDESAYYSLSMAQVNVLEKATNDLYAMCIEAGEHIIEKRRFAEFGIPEYIVPHLLHSWDQDAWSLFGRFDFSYDGKNPPKLLEFNADTPTSLFEASVVQWYWLESFAPRKDQFNSIHEKLVSSWKFIHEHYKSHRYHFACVTDSQEDLVTTQYILDAAVQANLNVKLIDISDIGWGGTTFMDDKNEGIETLFKLYPWEWMVHEEYGRFVPKTRMNWIEPSWKLMFSNKALLVVLYELFPDSPYLLPCHFEPKSASYVKKPKLSREGSNVEIVMNKMIVEATHGEYGEEGFVYQDVALLPNFDGNYPVVGSWIIGGEAAGIGIREANTLITDNMSRFLPHLIDG